MMMGGPNSQVRSIFDWFFSSSFAWHLLWKKPNGFAALSTISGVMWSRVSSSSGERDFPYFSKLFLKFILLFC